MGVAFESFTSELSGQQVSLLADTVQYFADAPKLLSIPDEQGNRVAVPILPDTMSSLLQVFPEGAEQEKRSFGFRWEAGDDEDKGYLVIILPDGNVLRQVTELSRFSAV
ncbi:hypothetical protein NDK47_12790 [Brevibacillus ruminantium]|uniref:Uncharacterized protein n=1 Tax=Brevibacillus ruminantium TaxID=2950604 RepID=A0ABY4WMW9_9BACL|nr:hypothetical protein [Brevibacillus ruminantium]USG68101.1 hypothetical protein NDK47_12790 [Brevibacillus ruminantium]